MTNQEVEKAYNDLISLENETRDFLVYICGDYLICERKKDLSRWRDKSQ